jgi:VCBS repeat-containing protein
MSTTRSVPVYGTSSADVIDRSSATSAQSINSMAGDDFVIGSRFDDRLYLGTGDDIVMGGAGNDTIVGGDGWDTAIYRGSIFDFIWSETRAGIYQITDTNTADGDEGTDTLSGIEVLQFDDFIFNIGGSNAALISAANQVTDEDSRKSFSFRAWDFDGGNLAIHSIRSASGGTFEIGSSTSLSSGMGVGKEFTVNFDPGNAYQHLKFGQSVIEDVEIVVSDGQGNLSTQIIKMTIHGVNDAPQITSATYNRTFVQEDGILQATGKVTATDVDGDALSFAVKNGTAGLYGSLAVDGQGNWTYNLNNSSAAVQALNTGQVVKDTFTIQVSDDNGGLVEQAISVDVHGLNEPQIPLQYLKLNFENLANTTTSLPIEKDYGGFNWGTNAFYVDTKHNAAFLNTTTSGKKVATDAAGATFEFSRATDFDFDSVQMTSVFTAGQSVTISGYNDGVLTGRQDVLITNATSFVKLRDDYFDRVDHVSISSPGPQFAMDDMTFYV